MINEIKNIEIEMKKILNLIVILFFGLTFAACGDDDDDELSSNGGNNSGGNTQTSYTLNQLAGYWVNSEQWRLCRMTIGQMPASGQAYSDVYLEDDILSRGVDGYYITSDGKAYQINLCTTTTKYANNDVAGNKVLKQWSCLDNKTVYFMNVIGGKYNSSCSVEGKLLNIGGNTQFSIITATQMLDSDGSLYEKCRMSL